MIVVEFAHHITTQETDATVRDTLQSSQDIIAMSPMAVWYLTELGVPFKTFHEVIDEQTFHQLVDDVASQLTVGVDKAFKEAYCIKILQLAGCIGRAIILQQHYHAHNRERLTIITDNRHIWQSDSFISNQHDYLTPILGSSDVMLDRIVVGKANKNNALQRLLFYFKIVPLTQLAGSAFALLKKRIGRLRHKATDLKDGYFFEAQTLVITLSPGPALSRLCLSPIKLDIHLPAEKISQNQFWLEDMRAYKVAYLFKHQRAKFSLLQHGSYLHPHRFTYASEVKYAQENIVLNNYTAQKLSDLGAKNVRFHKAISSATKQVQKKIDLVYVTQGHDYLGALTYNDFEQAYHSFDGMKMWRRHQEVMTYLGTMHRDKKIVVKVHPLVVKHGFYAPFWEAAKPYPNIRIDVFSKLDKLCESAHCVLTDYFASCLLDRKLWHKARIGMFFGQPTPLAEDVQEDVARYCYKMTALHWQEPLSQMLDSNTSAVDKPDENFLSRYVVKNT